MSKTNLARSPSLFCLEIDMTQREAKAEPCPNASNLGRSYQARAKMKSQKVAEDEGS